MGTFTGFVILQLFRKRRHSLRAGVKTDMPLEGCKVNQLAAFPVGVHTLGVFSFSLREAVFDSVIHLTQLRLYIFRLVKDIFFDRFGSFPAEVLLVCAAEGPAAPLAYPHHARPPISQNFFHRFVLGEFINKLVQISNLPHERIFDISARTPHTTPLMSVRSELG